LVDLLCKLMAYGKIIRRWLGMEYNGYALHDKFAKGRSSGVLDVSTSEVTFCNEQEDISFPTVGLSVKHGGAGNRMIYLRHNLFPEWTLVTSDKGILDDFSIKQNYHLRRYVKKIRAVRRFWTFFLFLIVAGMVSLLLGVVSFRGYFVKRIAQNIPVSWEKDMAEQLLPLFTKDNRIVADVQLNKRFQELLSPLLAVANENGYKYTIYIINDSEPNACALPGGIVVVNSGLILNATSAEQIVGVVAHELAHINLHHYTQNILSTVGTSVLLKALFGRMSTLGYFISKYGTTLKDLQYSREFEFEADAQGWEYMNRAKIDPRGLADFLQQIDKQQGEHLLKKITIIQTHPATKDRTKKLADKWNVCKNKDSFNKINFDLKKFKLTLKKLILI